MGIAQHHTTKSISLRGCEVAASFDYGPALFAHVLDVWGGSPHLLTADELRELADLMDEKLAALEADA